VVLAVFILVAGLFFWYLEGNYNLMFSGFADMTPVFELLPWLLIFVLPAISMKSFAEEYRTGTMETLLTKPVSKSQVVMGKWLAVWAVSLVMLSITVLYAWSLERLTLPTEQMDRGVLVSSFIGLMLLSGLWAMVGIWVSSLTQSQMAAYLGGVFVLFLMFYGLQGLASFQWVGTWDYTLRRWSVLENYRHFTHGLLDFKALAYLLLLTALFGWLTWWSLKKRYR